MLLYSLYRGTVGPLCYYVVIHRSSVLLCSLYRGTLGPLCYYVVIHRYSRSSVLLCSLYRGSSSVLLHSLFNFICEYILHVTM